MTVGDGIGEGGEMVLKEGEESKWSWLPAFIASASFLIGLKRCCKAAAVVPSLMRSAMSVQKSMSKFAGKQIKLVISVLARRIRSKSKREEK